MEDDIEAIVEQLEDTLNQLNNLEGEVHDQYYLVIDHIEHALTELNRVRDF
jgi:prephenate dehydrogenase